MAVSGAWTSRSSDFERFFIRRLRPGSVDIGAKPLFYAPNIVDDGPTRPTQGHEIARPGDAPRASFGNPRLECSMTTRDRHLHPSGDPNDGPRPPFAPPSRLLRARGRSGAVHSRRSLFALPLVLPILGMPTGADAWRGWCRRDPVFKIGGEVAHVRIAVNVDKMRTARRLGTGDPIGILLTVPDGVDARFLGTDNGFGYGYDVRVEHSSELIATDQFLPVGVAAFVPMINPNIAVRVSFIPTVGDNALKAAAAPGTAHGEPPVGSVLSPGSAIGAVNSWVAFTATGAVAEEEEAVGAAPGRDRPGQGGRGRGGGGGGNRRS